MLSISLGPEEYVTIGDDIVVKVSRMAKGRCFLAIEADRTVPIVRGTVREREGAPPPECIAARKAAQVQAGRRLPVERRPGAGGAHH